MWTVVRTYYGLPSYMNDYLCEGDEGDCFIFDTEYEANKCIEFIFENGKWFEDERYGKVRYYADTFNLDDLQNRNAMSKAYAEIYG